MKIAILRERQVSENRVAITPDLVKSYKDMGFEVCIEGGAGTAASYSDECFESAGAKISKVLLEILADADILLKVQNSPTDEKVELEYMKEGSIIIGMMSPFENAKYFENANAKKINIFSMEFVPRITRAQSMDVLSSQSNLAGYRAVIEASYHYSKLFPMLMTAAGTISPAKVLILGAGVAGLQAIATAKRLGAVVNVFDVRAAAKEQVESLGAKFVEVESDEDMETSGGYAKEASEEYKRKQSRLIDEYVVKSDIVITTALIPGKKAPTLVTRRMVEDMKSGSVVIDLAAISGGNCELTELDNIVEFEGKKIVGLRNILSSVATDASKMYSKNLYNFVKLLFDSDEKKIQINLDDEIIKHSLITSEGKVINERLKT
ncbi:MAG: Re/Si-specific NAD(P)(+) transhydrogenase subunit alpha [Rickettsiales bacterium]